MKPETKHGVVKEITGPGVRWGEIEIYPARVELDGNGWMPELGLSGFLQAGFASNGVVKALCKKRIESVWVLGRLLQLFDLPLVAAVDRCEKSMMDYQFVAICREQTGLVAYPFWCSDYYGASNLCFGSSFMNSQLKRGIAGAFWGLVLSGTEVRDYDGEMSHVGGGFDVRYGIEDGETYYREEGSPELQAYYEDLLRKLKKVTGDE